MGVFLPVLPTVEELFFHGILTLGSYIRSTNPIPYVMIKAAENQKLTERQLVIRGQSGSEYRFDIYRPNSVFTEPKGAICLFTKRKMMEDNTFDHDYIHCDRTDDITIHLKNHERKSEFKKHEMNCLCIKTGNTAAEREHIVEDIRAHNEFKCK